MHFPMLIKRAFTAFDHIETLRTLSDGWNYGHGRSPDGDALEKSRTILMMLLQGGAEECEAFPEDNGGVLIIGYRAADRFEILARADGGLECAYNDEAPAPLDHLFQLKDELEARGWQSQRSSGSFTRSIIASGSADIPRSHFVIRKGEFLSLTPLASLKRAGNFAPISAPSIPPEFEELHPVSGGFQSRNLLQVTG